MPAGGRELGTRPHLPPGNALEVLAQEVAVLLSVGGAYGHEIPGRQDARVTIVALARIEHQHPSAPPPLDQRGGGHRARAPRPDHDEILHAAPALGAIVSRAMPCSRSVIAESGAMHHPLDGDRTWQGHRARSGRRPSSTIGSTPICAGSSTSSSTPSAASTTSASTASPASPTTSAGYWSWDAGRGAMRYCFPRLRSEEHTSELQSHSDLVCRLLLEKKK